MSKHFFRIGNGNIAMEYRGNLAWEIVKSQLPGLKMAEAIASMEGGKPVIASDLIDAAFSLADCFVDKLEYRGDLQPLEIEKKEII